LLQFSVVLNTGQIHAVDFVILQQQRFARRAKNWIPAEAAKVSATDPASATRRYVAVQSESGRTDGSQQKQKCRNWNPTFHEVASNFFFASVSGRLRQARILNRGCTKTRAFFKPGVALKSPPGVTLGY
jgi:hypothetical protein